MKHSWIALLFLLTACQDNPTATIEDHAETVEEKLTPRSWQPDSPTLVRGKEIYLQECSLCHDEGEESAPKIASSKAWTERLAKGEDILIQHAIEGFTGEKGEMPARGGTESLTDEEVADAVRFIMAFPR